MQEFLKYERGFRAGVGDKKQSATGFKKLGIRNIASNNMQKNISKRQYN